MNNNNDLDNEKIPEDTRPIARERETRQRERASSMGSLDPLGGL